MKFDDLFSDEDGSGIFEEDGKPDEVLTHEEQEDVKEVVDTDNDEKEKVKEEEFSFEENDESLFGEDDDQEEEEEKEKAPTSKKKNITKTKTDFISSLSAVYKEEGLIPSFDEKELNRITEEEGEVAALKYLNDLQREAIAEELRKNYSEDKNELEEFFKLKDLGIDPEVAKELIHNKATFEKVTEDDLEDDEELRRKVLYQNYKNTTAFSEAKIKKEIDKTFAAGDDIEEAKEALADVKAKVAKEIEAEKVRIKEYEKQQKEAIANERKSFMDLVDNTEEIIQGVKLTKQIKDKIKSMVLEPAVKLDNGQQINAIWAERMKDPKKFEMNLAYQLITGTFYGKNEELEKKAKSKAAENLEKVVKSTSTAIKGKSTVSNSDDNWRTLAKELGI